jgi:hypothetical protein
MADDDDTEKKGLALLMDTIYQEAFAYQSIKMMKIWDWRLTCACARARRRALARCERRDCHRTARCSTCCAAGGRPAPACDAGVTCLLRTLRVAAQHSGAARSAWLLARGASADATSARARILLARGSTHAPGACSRVCLARALRYAHAPSLRSSGRRAPLFRAPSCCFRAQTLTPRLRSAARCARLAAADLTRAFTLGQCVYALFYVILYHGYFQKEEPFVSVDVKLDANNLARAHIPHTFRFATSHHLFARADMRPVRVPAPPALRQFDLYPNLTWVNENTTNFDLKTTFSTYGKPVLSFPELKAYCATGATDYTWGQNGTRAYVNNTCVPYYTPAEYTERGYQSAWVYTYWQQQHWARECVDASEVPKYFIADPPDYPVAPDEDKTRDFADPGWVPNCGDAQLVAQRSVLTLAPERVLNVTIMGTYTTTWGRTRSAMATRVGPRAATTSLEDPATGAPLAPVEFSATDKVTLDFETLLSLSGIDLDDYNTLDDGGRGPDNGTAWPTYRITGVTLVAQMVYGNFVENGTLDPFNFADHLDIQLFPATAGTFATPGTRLFYSGRSSSLLTQAGVNETHPYADSLFTTRTPYGVQIQFYGAGFIGRFDGIVLLSALVTIIILSSAAQSITDITAGFLIDGFRSQKYMDDLELRIRLMLRSQLADSPVPEQVRMFEAETLELYSNRAYDASQRMRMAELERKAAEAEAARGGAVGAADGAGDAPPEVEEEVILPLESRGAALRGAPPEAQRAAGATRAAQLAAAAAAGVPAPPGLSSIVPRVATLLVAGEPYHGTPLTAQGFLENCRCVRFQWLRSAAGSAWEPIPFATLPTFFPCADDAGCLIAVEATPVTDDGFEGGAKRARIGPLTTSPSMTQRVAALVNRARSTPAGADISDGVTRAGARAVLAIRPLDVALRPAARGAPEFGRLPMAGALVVLDRRDGRAMHVTAALGGDAAPSLSVTLEGPEQRDEVALAIRQLATAAAPGDAAGGAAGPVEAPTDDEGEEGE